MWRPRFPQVAIRCGSGSGLPPRALFGCGPGSVVADLKASFGAPLASLGLRSLVALVASVLVAVAVSSPGQRTARPRLAVAA